MKRRLQNFIFRGLLINNELEALEDGGLITKQLPSLNTDTGSKGETISIEDFTSKIRMEAIKMSSVYMAFFAFENSVRDLVKQRLAERIGAEWWGKSTSEKVRKKVDDRKKKDAKNKWHAPRAADEIAYTDFGDMSDIIINNWEHFEDLFPNQDWIKNRLSDLEQSRNAIAHNNALADRDIQRIKMYAQDWLSQVG